MPTDPLAVEPLLVPDALAARLTGVSRATWWPLHSAGFLILFAASRPEEGPPNAA